MSVMLLWLCFFFSSRRRHTRCALVTGVQTCALPILRGLDGRFVTMNSNISGDRAFWQLKIALNVAAIGCRGIEEPTLVAAYNNIRSEEHTSELQSLMRSSYAVFCLKKKTIVQTQRIFTLNINCDTIVVKCILQAVH